jgi:hypothetical protein
MDAMMEYKAMMREEKERLKQYYQSQQPEVKSNIGKQQWIVDASTVVNFEVIVEASNKDEAIAKAKASLNAHDSNVYEDYGDIKIDDAIEIQNG